MAATGSGHPAARAWRKVEPPGAAPTVEVETLQRRKKGSVYRLVGAGPARSDVVAKHASRERILRESLAYEEVLPALALGTVRYYGSLADEDGEGAWLFVSYAGRENFSVRAPGDRELAALWLATLHTSPPKGCPDRLPDRGPGFYRRQVRPAREQILEQLGNPALTSHDVELLAVIVQFLERVSSRWTEVRRICDLTPRALVHGDFAPKNIRVARGGSTRLLAFDWASGGWGVPATDLPQLDETPSTYWANPDLNAYRTAVAPWWGDLSREDLSAIATVGKILRTVWCLRLEAVGLATDWPEASMRDMRYYRRDLDDAFRVLCWSP